MESSNICPVHNEDDLVCGSAAYLTEKHLTAKVDSLTAELASVKAELKIYQDEERRALEGK